MAANCLEWVFDEDRLSLPEIFTSKIRFVASNIKVRGQADRYTLLEALF